MDSVRSLGKGLALFAMLQGLIYVALGVLAILTVKTNLLGTAGFPSGKDFKWSDYAMLLRNLYFNDKAALPDLPPAGLATPRVVFYVAAVVTVANAVWFITSAVMHRQLRLGGRDSAASSVHGWTFVTVVVTVVDVVFAFLMGRDIYLMLAEWPKSGSFKGNFVSLVLCPTLLLVLAVRAGFGLITNVIGMLVLQCRVAVTRQERAAAEPLESPSATKREGPIDAFLYQNDPMGSYGMLNPVFVPDEGDEDPRTAWASFKSPPNAAGNRSHQGARRDDPHDVSHLSWMEEADKHVNVRPRPGTQPSAPPQHRYGMAEPTYPVGMLPRARVNPDAPRFPYVPPPDYSPPSARRATGKAAPPHAQYGYAHAGHAHYGQPGRY